MKAIYLHSVDYMAQRKGGSVVRTLDLDWPVRDVLGNLIVVDDGQTPGVPGAAPSSAFIPGFTFNADGTFTKHAVKEGVVRKHVPEPDGK